MIKEFWGKHKLQLLITMCIYIAIEIVIIRNNVEKFRIFAWSVVLFLFLVLLIILIYYGIINVIELIENNKMTSVIWVLCLGIIAKMVLNCVADQSLSTIIGRYMIVFQLLVIPVVVLGLFGIYVWKLKYWQLYLAIAIFIGIAMMLLIPIGSVPDEVFHINASYRLSNVFLGIQNGSNSTPMRMDDYLMASHDYANGAYKSSEQFSVYISELLSSLKSDKLVTSAIKPSSISYTYFLPALGIAIGRIIGLGTYQTLMLGRIFNFSAFIVMTTYAIRIIPIGKLPLMVILLMPMTVQQGMSYSYDVYVNGLSAVVVAYTVMIVYEGESRLDKKNLVTLLISSMLLFSLKFFAYFLISILPWIILIERRYPLSKQTITKLKKIVIILVILSIVCFIIWGMTGASNYHYKNVYLTYDKNIEGYSIGYFIAHPFELLYVICHTLIIKSDFYVNSFVGEYLCWLDVPMSHHITELYIVLLVLASIKRIGDDRDILRKYKKCFVWIAVITFGFILAGMLVSWSPIAGRTIEGVQGRYLIPCVMLILLVMRSKHFQIDRQANKLILVMSMMLIIYDLEYFMICL
jgi:uncharacterized membrane protein